MISPEAKPSPYVFKPFAGSSHWLILKTLSRMTPPLRVCDVGTGAGHLARACRAMGHHVVGIDRDRTLAKGDAWNRFIEADLSRTPIRGLDSTDAFDVFVLADILEHLPDPPSLLAELIHHAAPRTLFIVSVPNVANLVVRLGLLAGRFDYAERGILDADHLRFYTLRTFRSLLESVRLRVDHLWATSVPFPLLWPDRFEGGRLEWLNRLGFSVTNSWKRLLGYQFVALATPAEGCAS